MKTKIIFSTLLLALSAHAGQTNWLTAAPNFREVNGQLYNIELSTNWTYFRGWFIETNADGLVFRETVEKLVERNPFTEPFSPHEYLINAKGDYCILKSYPKDTLEFWDHVGLKVMKTGEREFRGKTISVYDCGTPHRVAVIEAGKTATNGNSKTILKKP